MPGWILVANRFSLLPIMRKYGRLSTVTASLTCLVVVAGCSNIRQQSLELPLPALPSEAAVATDTNDESDFPLLTSRRSAAGTGTTENPINNAPIIDQTAISNDFPAIKVEQIQSVQSFLPPENELQLKQPSARFVGTLDKADVKSTDITITDAALPAPTIAAASHESKSENCETCESPEVCEVDETGQCGCCKKSELPKLAKMEPLGPEQLTELFGSNRTRAEATPNAPLPSALKPVQTADSAAEPIRLVAMQDTETTVPQERRAIAELAQTQNKAQLLIPIAPAELQAYKAESEQLKAQAARTTAAAARTIKVSPLIDLNLAKATDSFAAPVAATAEMVDANQSKFIPVSTSGIQVSAVPFQSLPALIPTPVIVPVEPVKELEPAASAAAVPPIQEPTPKVAMLDIVQAIEIPQPTKIIEVDVDSDPVDVVELVEDLEQASQMASNNFSPLLSISERPIEAVVKRKTDASATQSEMVKQTDQSFQAPTAVEIVDDETNDFAVTPPSVNIDPLADENTLEDENPLTNENPSPDVVWLEDFDRTTRADPMMELSGLPDPSQIEKDHAELAKSNKFDPSSIDPLDRMDPRVLLAKLDGPAKPIVPIAPPKIIVPAPNNDLIEKQLAAQNSVLQKLQKTVDQLKPKPVTVTKVVPELTLSNAAFCTKISGFGQFKPFASNSFSGSQKTLLYCEVENQTSKQFTNSDGSQQFETVLRASLVIRDESGNIVQTANFPVIKDVARQRRRDFYVYFPVQFDNLTRGVYDLELSVEDASASETAVLRPFMRFSVK